MNLMVKTGFDIAEDIVYRWYSLIRVCGPERDCIDLLAIGISDKLIKFGYRPETVDIKINNLIQEWTIDCDGMDLYSSDVQLNLLSRVESLFVLSKAS